MRVDLRSDTVTMPSAGMRRAMADAAVGDDVWGEDPTVIELQQRVAALLDKQAALYVPSGTMANQAALRAHTSHGDEVLLGWGSHCTNYEAGAAAALSGVQPRELGQGGQFTAADLAAAFNPGGVHHPPQTLVWLENTHNRGGGRIFPQDEVEAIARLAHDRGLAVHLDGARLLNAAVALGRSPAELVAPVDSTSICLSKGLGAPVGSVLAGSAEFIERAHRYRKMLGGGMRQAGIIAAAGIYALDHNVARLTVDHDNARTLAEALVELPGLLLEPARLPTNIVVFDLAPGLPDAEALIARCAEDGVLFSQFGPRRVRAVTHLDVDHEACCRAAAVVKQTLKDFA